MDSDNCLNCWTLRRTMATEEADPNIPITVFGQEPNASRLLGRMLVIVFDRQHPKHLVQGRIERLWVKDDEPDVLRIKLSGMMRFYPDAYSTWKGDWRYEEESTRTLELQELGPRATSVTIDTVTDEIIMALMDQGYKIKITSRDTKHPNPETILPATGPIQSSHK